MLIVESKKQTAARLATIIAELKSKRDATKTELDAYIRSIGLAAVDGADVHVLHVLNEEKRNLENDLVAIDAQIVEVNRRLETTHAEESRAEGERLRKKQIADYVELDSLARRMADKIIEIDQNNRRLADLGASRPSISRFEYGANRTLCRWTLVSMRRSGALSFNRLSASARSLLASTMLTARSPR